MKLQTIVSAVLFAAVSALSFGAHAEDVAPAKKMMKPHSHMEEKVTGTTAPKVVDASAAADGASKPADAKAEKHAKKGKNTNHSHPRDAK